jgi:hypothetical protein
MPDKKPSIAPSLIAPLNPAYLERGQLDAFAGRAGMWRVSIWCLRDGLLTQYLATQAATGSRLRFGESDRVGLNVPKIGCLGVLGALSGLACRGRSGRGFRVHRLTWPRVSV